MNQSIIYYSPQIIQQPVTNNGIQTVFVRQPSILNQSGTSPQATIPLPKPAPVQTTEVQTKSTLSGKSGSRYLPPMKKISNFSCDFGECELSFHSVEDLR